MNSDKRKRLLGIIEKLGLSLSPEKTKEITEKLSSEEIELLVSTYEDIKNYQDAVDAVLKEVAAKEYGELQRKYDNKQKEIYKKYLAKIKGAQKKKDGKLDKLDKDTAENLEEILKEQDKTLDTLEEARSDLYSKLNSAISE